MDLLFIIKKGDIYEFYKFIATNKYKHVMLFGETQHLPPNKHKVVINESLEDIITSIPFDTRHLIAGSIHTMLMETNYEMDLIYKMEGYEISVRINNDHELSKDYDSKDEKKFKNAVRDFLTRIYIDMNFKSYATMANARREFYATRDKNRQRQSERNNIHGRSKNNSKGNYTKRDTKRY
jgi:hypothetical protein